MFKSHSHPQGCEMASINCFGNGMQSSPIKEHTDINSHYSSPSQNNISQSLNQKQYKSSLSNSSGKIERDQISLIERMKVQISGWNLNIFGSSRNKCKCQSNLNDDSQTCYKAMEWILSYYSPKDISKLKEDYIKLSGEVQRLVEQKQASQIEKDLQRTYGLAQFLDKNILRRILLIWSIFDPNIGYVQGINFIVASLLYHAEEYIAFYLLEMLIGRFEMRDIYQEDLPGLSKHCKMISKLTSCYLPNLHGWLVKSIHFPPSIIVLLQQEEQDIQFQLICSQWIFSLFNVMIPLKYSSLFYDYLFKQKWVYFYKVVLQLLENYEQQFLQMEGVEILEFFSTKNLKSFEESEIKVQNIDWEHVLNEAALIRVDKQEIENILDKFDSESKEFKFSEHDNETLYSQIQEFQELTTYPNI